MSINNLSYTPAQIAEQFVNHTNRNIFLTGKAGTGKTTFLKKIIATTHKKTIVAAPTGIAALNAGGVTLHSQFQLPLGGFIPAYKDFIANESIKFETKSTILRHLRMNDVKRQTIKEAELLIIDEVSMLRADVLDAIDFMLQSIRRKRVSFGGLQVLFIGDLLQLPPVIKNEEWELLQDYYNSPFFFDAVVLRDAQPIYIELDKIYRQKDKDFTKILNNLRYNQLTNDDAEVLNDYYKPDFKPAPEEGYITLTTHNRFADEINQRELSRLYETPFAFEAVIENEYPDSMIPVEKRIVLKEGAQVMFIKNDVSGQGKFFNGKIGIVETLSEEKIVVKTDTGSIVVEKHEWQNIRYNVDENTREIKEEVLGVYRQYPLRLAWAITIHKSQGLTFEKAIIDVRNVFAAGQAYVALSRLTSLDGLVLSSQFSNQGIDNNEEVIRFEGTKHRQGDATELLDESTFEYLRDYSIAVFDFSLLIKEWQNHLASYNKDDTQSEKQQHLEWAESQYDMLSAISQTSTKFRVQLIHLFNEPEVKLEHIAKRLEAAKNYFDAPIKDLCGNVFLQKKKMAQTKGAKAYANELEDLDAAILNRLKDICKAMVMAQSLVEKDFFTKEKWLQNFDLRWRVTLAQTVVDAPAKKKKVKAETYQVTYSLYSTGKSIEDIAKERNLSIGTIQGHFARLISTGVIQIEAVMPTERFAKIKEALTANPQKTVGEIMTILNNEFTYGEMRMVMAHNENEPAQ
jgi:predicted transcriptional regulator